MSSGCGNATSPTHSRNALSPKTMDRRAARQTEPWSGAHGSCNETMWPWQYRIRMWRCHHDSLARTLHGWPAPTVGWKSPSTVSSGENGVAHEPLKYTALTRMATVSGSTVSITWLAVCCAMSGHCVL